MTQTGPPSSSAQVAGAGGAVQVDGVADAAVAGGQHDRGAVADQAEVADQPGVEHGVQVGAVGAGALAQPGDGAAAGGGEAHGYQDAGRSGIVEGPLPADSERPLRGAAAAAAGPLRRPPAGRPAGRRAARGHRGRRAAGRGAAAVDPGAGRDPRGEPDGDRRGLRPAARRGLGRGPARLRHLRGRPAGAARCAAARPRPGRRTGPARRRSTCAAACPCLEVLDPAGVAAGLAGGRGPAAPTRARTRSAGRRSGPPWSSTCCGTAGCRSTPGWCWPPRAAPRRSPSWPARCRPAPGWPSRSPATSGRWPRCGTPG